LSLSGTGTHNAVKSPLKHFVANNVLLLVLYGALLLAFLGLSFYSPNFRSGANLWTLARQAAIPGLIAIAQTVIIISGGIDLSVASLVTIVTLLTAGLMNNQPPLFLPVAGLLLLFGAGVGFLNGLIVQRGRVHPFITTLGMALLLQGAGLAYMTVPRGGVPRNMGDLLYYQALGPVPYPVIIFVLVFAGCFILLHWTRFGRSIYAIGGDPEVARRSGLGVARISILVYGLGSLLTALAGLMTAARMGIGDPLSGMGMELDSITAVVIGGTSLFGGRGNLFGTLAGVLILILINNVMVILGVNVFYQQLIKGFVVLLVVALYKQRL